MYRNGKISTGKAAKELGMSISEFIDLLEMLGIRSDITYEDFVESQRTMKKLWK